MSIYGELSEGNVLKGTVSGGQSLSGSADKINVIKGESAYQLAVLNGFEGTEAEWLESLHGRDGKSVNVDTYYETDEGTLVMFSDGTEVLVRKGEDGKSAYEYAKEKGYDGTEEEFAEMLANAGSGGGGIIEETDPTVPSWAKQPQKPKYDATEITFIQPDSQSLLPSGTVDDALGEIDLFLRGVPDWAKQTNKPTYSKSEVGLGNVDNVRQYSASNPPPYPVTSVNGKTGAVTVSVPTQTSQLTNNSGFITKAVSDLENYYKKSEVYSKDEIDKKGFLTDHQDISGKLDASKLPEAINSALAQAKESGAFDGENGYTPVKGVDYFTDADKDEIKGEIITESVTQNTGNSTRLVMSQDAVTRAIEAFTALPYGGSKEWLEINGDKAKLYQIGGYVWGYVDSDGWTKSDVQFRVVRGTFEMTDTGGIPYLSCPTGATSGAVYKYTEASGDIGVPVYDSKPTTANEGDIIAVGERKYKASLTSKQVPAFTNLAVTLHKNKRYNSSGALVDQSGACACEDFIPFASGTVVRIKGLGDLNTYNFMGYDNASTTVKASFKPSAASVSGDYLTYSYDSATGTATLTSKGHSYVQRMRATGVLKGSVADVIITVNEKISYNTETTVTWTDIGAYTPPTEAGWSATDEVYNVIDSLDATASNGESAVYRADGFLYSFVGGSDWVQMSRYDAPTIAVDGELSDSSTNAVQNKVVTVQLNEIHGKVNTHTSELSAIKDQLGNIATVPSFWQSAVDACIAKIKVLQKGRNCVTFPFFSDNHTRDGKTQYMGILIAHIMKECGIPYCFFGGDAITSAMASTADSDAEFKAMAKAFDTAMSYIPDGRFFMALGNHETWLVANPNIAGSTRVDYDRNQQYEIFLRNKLSRQNAHLGGDGTYYYVDDIASKVRWIVLNTNGIGDSHIDTEQLWWFEGEALHFTENGWGVVIISHIPITNHYEQSNIGNNTDVIDIVKRYKEAVGENQADIIGWYSGHIHRDRIYSGVSVNDTDDTQGEDMGFKQVTITSDHTGIAYPIGNSPTYHPIANDDKSHAIDFVTINKDLRQVNITRLGIGSDRSYTY